MFLIRRGAAFVATLLAASALIFAVLALLPGSAVDVRLETGATPEAAAALAQQLGLDQPPLVRYGRWLRGLASGDLGRSVAYDAPIAELLAERLLVTVPLALIAMVLTVVFALALGVFAASRHRRLGDAGVMAISQLGMAVPNFWLAILLIGVFAVKLQWFPAGGFDGWQDDPAAALRSLLLPAMALAAVQVAILARVTRSAVLEVMREDFVRSARAQGLGRRAVLWRHVLRNALVPVLTVMGLQFANLLTGAIVVEKVFALPGLGLLVFQAIANRDLAVVQNVVMLFAGAVIAINFAVDLLLVAVDPRLKAVHR